MRIVYDSQFRDSSGYSVAARGYLAALDNYAAKHPDQQIELRINTVQLEGKLSQITPSEIELLDRYEFKTMEEVDAFIAGGPYLYLYHRPAPMMTWEEQYHTKVPAWARSRKLVHGAAATINITTWEADKIPAIWSDCYRKYKTKDIIVPSWWNRNVFLNSVKSINCSVVPHVVERTMPQSQPCKVPVPDIDNRFVVFSMSQWNIRKGFDKLILAYSMEFAHQKDVLLLIKTYGVIIDGAPQDEQNQRIFHEVKQYKGLVYLDNFGEQPTADIVVIPGVLPYEQVAWLYEKADLFALPTRGEGFGLTLAEAMLYGLPILTTKETGHSDFICPGGTFMVGGEWSPYVSKPEYSCNMNWFEPSILDIRKGLRRAYVQWREGTLAEMGAENQAYLGELKLSRQKIGVKLAKILRPIWNETSS